MDDNMMKKENIIILPYNTLRLVDVTVQMEINKANGKPLSMPFEELIYILTVRSHKDLSWYNKKVDKNLIDELYKVNFATYYDMAPRTQLNDILTITSNQKFTESTKVLFTDKNATDDFFECDYYDGSIDSLEKYILDNNISCIVMDDIELLYEINNRKNIPLNGKTVMVSKLGYNFEYDDKINKLRLKHYDEIIKDNPNIELTVMDLFDFSKEVIERVKERRKNIKAVKEGG